MTLFLLFSFGLVCAIPYNTTQYATIQTVLTTLCSSQIAVAPNDSCPITATSTTPFNCDANGNLVKITIGNFSGCAGGSIASEIGLLPFLQYFDARNTGIVGTIPTTLAQCKLLTYLSLFGNSLVGLVPSELLTLRTVLANCIFQRTQGETNCFACPFPAFQCTSVNRCNNTCPTPPISSGGAVPSSTDSSTSTSLITASTSPLVVSVSSSTLLATTTTTKTSSSTTTLSTTVLTSSAEAQSTTSTPSQTSTSQSAVSTSSNVSYQSRTFTHLHGSTTLPIETSATVHVTESLVSQSRGVSNTVVLICAFSICVPLTILLIAIYIAVRKRSGVQIFSVVANRSGGIDVFPISVVANRREKQADVDDVDEECGETDSTSLEKSREQPRPAASIYDKVHLAGVSQYDNAGALAAAARKKNSVTNNVYIQPTAPFFTQAVGDEKND